MTNVEGSPTHWIVEVARKAELPGAGSLRVPAGVPVGDAWTMVSQGTGTPVAELAQAVARHFRLPLAELSSAEAKAIRLLPESVARRFQAFPLREDYRQLVVATSDPVNFDAEQAIGFASGRTPAFAIATPNQIEEAILEHYAPDQAVEQFLSRVDGGVGGLVRLLEEEEEESRTQPDASELATGPVARLANMILEDAVQKGASDIHIQPTATGGVVRMRVDGVLRGAAQLPHAALVRVVARMKIMGRMDIADRLRPQDGRARIALGERTFDLRISTVPTRHAEKCVIRILDPGQAVALADAGIPEPALGRLQRLLTQREGIVVVTGPTGSGKTTTMYAALREIATEDINIMTVEDPVEYELPGLTQIQVETRQGVTFASALRAMLRQDPDVIFIGEIRDSETAAIAVQASLTGHLVLATLHANDAVAAIRRLSDLGLDRASIGQTLRGSVAQRLVRRVCPHCSRPIEGPLSEDEARLAEEFGVRPRVRAVGCDRCSHTGYRGRIPIAQVFVMGPEVEPLVLGGAGHAALLEAARAAGMRTLRESGAQRVQEGVTTLQELERVLGDVEAGEGEEDRDAGEADGSDAGEAAHAAGAGTGAAAGNTPGAGGGRAGPGPGDTPGAGGGRAGPGDTASRTGPVAPAGRAAGIVAPDATGDADNPGPSPRIRSLVVDDDPGTRIIGKALLESLGHQVVEAGDGEEALIRLREGEPVNLVILDLDLPRRSGRQVLADIRADVATAGIPVVVLTGSQDPSSEMEVMDAGADDYLRKPLDPSRFLSRVRAALRRAMG